MKPIIKYRGGKSKEIPQIIQYIPQFDGRYIEPFLGGGAMFFHLEPNNAIINDINVRLINFYRSVQQDFMQLSMELAELENIYSNNRLEFDKLKKRKHSVNHVFLSPTSIINFTSKKQSYDDTRRSSRDNELLQRAQSDL